MIFNKKEYIIYEKINYTTYLNLVLTFCSSMIAFAKGPNSESDMYIVNLKDGISPHWDLTCPGGKHRMKSNGKGVVYDTSGNRVINGYCYQCSNCFLVLASQHDPRISHTLGKYHFHMAYEPIGITGIIINNATYIEEFNGDTRTDSFWQSFEFIKGL